MTTMKPRASLYQDFGGKEGLFIAATAHYVKTRIGPVAEVKTLLAGSIAERCGLLC